MSLLIFMGILIMLPAAVLAQDKKGFANNNQISGKQSGGKSIAESPDVVKSPPSPPAGPLQAPYPIISGPKDSQSGSERIKGQGKKVENKTSIPKTEDEKPPNTETKKLKSHQQPATPKP